MFINFNNTYIKLGEKFFSRVLPTPVPKPNLIHFNYSLADELDINIKNTENKEMAEIFSGNKIPETSDPIALVYAGHQFGKFVSQLGDGRAILLGEIIDKNGNRKDIQLKGSGKTPYSRNGDGRAPLGPIIREYIISEAMYTLGIKTTRSLAIVKTGEEVYREKKLPGAILTRVAESHIRIGSFEYFAAKNDIKSLKLLADYAINRHYSYIRETPDPYYAFLQEVMYSQIFLIINWMRVGFIHGVMNTDNMSISGETIDYGPCAFMDFYKPSKVFSSIDYYGRYAFNKQGDICLWNIIQLAQSLLPLIDISNTEHNYFISNLISLFKATFNKKWLEMMLTKIGITKVNEQNTKLIYNLLHLMEEEEMDYTLTFRYLSYKANDKVWPYKELFIPSLNLTKWEGKWLKRLQEQKISFRHSCELMFKINPAFIPRNHIIESVIESAIIKSDFSKMFELITVLLKPYDEQKNYIKYIKPPTSTEIVAQTFCGT